MTKAYAIGSTASASQQDAVQVARVREQALA
jgi:hypothetical protein